MSAKSMRRRSKGRGQWRFIVGISVLGLLIIASASHASQPDASSHSDVKISAAALTQ
jgi:hypothetical protein